MLFLKDTLLFTNLHGAHFDKKIWGDPENFRPERFIDEKTGLLKKKDYSLPFGAGTIYFYNFINIINIQFHIFFVIRKAFMCWRNVC